MESSFDCMELSKAAIRKLVDGKRNEVILKILKKKVLSYFIAVDGKKGHLTLVSGIDQHNLLLVHKQSNKNAA